MAQENQPEQPGHHTHGDNYGHNHSDGQLPHSHSEGNMPPTNDEAAAKPVDIVEEMVEQVTEAIKPDISGPEQSVASQVQDMASEATSGFAISKNLADVQSLAGGWLEQILAWLQSPPFLAQIGAIALAFFLSPILAGLLKKRLFFFRDKPTDDTRFKVMRDYVYRSRDFLRAILLVLLLAVFAAILTGIGSLGQNGLVKIAQGLAVVFLLFKLIKEFIPHPVVQKVVTWIVIPVAVLMVFGYFDKTVAKLDSTELMSLGETPITALTFIKLAIFGGIFFWIGSVSSAKGQTAIRNQESLDVGTREVVAKIFQILLFFLIFFIVMSSAGIPLSGLVFLLSFAGLGIGLGLQPVAANFVSGLIILFDRTVQVGDFVVLPEGQEGFVEAINMRSTTVETTDGKDIMVPNTTFIENTYENWTHKDPRQRYEVYFQVEYGTDIDTLEDIIIPVFEANESVLSDPEEPDLELREFGEYGIKFAVEFWCSGIDDGPNKFTSDLNFEVWRALKKAGIKMPLPQREVRMLK